MYQESYYNFCARLMEQEGLIWTHRYEKDKHILVIGDTNFVFRPIEGLTTVPYADSEASEFNGIDQLHEGRRFGVGKVTFQDFNHQNPSSPLMLVQAEPQTLRHARLDATSVSSTSRCMTTVTTEIATRALRCRRRKRRRIDIPVAAMHGG